MWPMLVEYYCFSLLVPPEHKNMWCCMVVDLLYVWLKRITDAKYILKGRCRNNGRVGIQEALLHCWRRKVSLYTWPVCILEFWESEGEACVRQCQIQRGHLIWSKEGQMAPHKWNLACSMCNSYTKVNNSASVQTQNWYTTMHVYISFSSYVGFYISYNMYI